MIALICFSSAVASPVQHFEDPGFPYPSPSSTPAGYRIGVGDKLDIDVWREPRASVSSVTVRPDGKISLPLLKQVSVVGLTRRELEKLLTDKLAVMPHHRVHVTIVVTGPPPL